MPRKGVILEFSREHHGALVLARDCQRIDDAAPPAVIAAMNQRIARYWDEEMRAHFRAEETLLRAHPQALPKPLAVALLDDHGVLAVGCTRAGAGALAAADLRAFGERLHAHVRFEDRRCFPLLQAALGD
ncbi:hemerythrin domain-containing protein [Lysobacter pythonis]|uniref:Hemerythrin domain-containing protein n=1 Tax=Solilutibacter pythonis TaxID=2483112 RepID=A0A3M2HYU0_9GAMM|nr:hemerythrin domain-containing protein [Lysobacter pythonis]RMH92820.1 hemerythrin domain-containing protein [Lysobacter pythonis]